MIALYAAKSSLMNLKELMDATNPIGYCGADWSQFFRIVSCRSRSLSWSKGPCYFGRNRPIGKNCGRSRISACHDGMADVKQQHVKVLLPVLAQVGVRRIEALWFK